MKHRDKPKLAGYLEFSRVERIAATSLATACLLVFLAPEVGRVLRPKKSSDFSKFQREIAVFRAAAPLEKQQGDKAAPGAAPFVFDPNSATFDDFVALGISEKTANTILNYRDKGGRFYEPDDFKKIYGLAAEDFERLEDFIEINRPEKDRFEKRENAKTRPAELFTFDPNTASGEDFQRLGLSERLAATIEKYRSKGGVFRSKNDFQKIYTLAESDFRRLEPFIEIVQTKAADAPRPMTYAAGFSTPTHSFSTTSEKIEDFDINKSSIEDWQRLPGIGAVRAQKIVYFREKLGGFSGIEQVAEARGLPDSVFQKIKPVLVFQTPVFKKINLNSATAEEFQSHPYFDKRQTSLILAYRAQHGDFKSVGEISSIGAFRDKGWLAKVLPYLSVE